MTSALHGAGSQAGDQIALRPQEDQQHWRDHEDGGCHHDATQRQLWVAWDEASARRLEGGAVLDAGMVLMRRLCTEQGKRWEEVVAWAVAEGHAVYGLRRGMTFRYYIRPRALARAQTND